MLRQKLKLKLIESKENMKLTQKEEKKPPKLNKLLKMLPTPLLKKPLKRPRKLDKLKKINNLQISPRKWKRESLNSKTNMNMFG